MLCLNTYLDVVFVLDVPVSLNDAALEKILDAVDETIQQLQSSMLQSVRLGGNGMVHFSGDQTGDESNPVAY